jgi:DNA-binding FrmR family transcriptional regulator
MKIQNQEAKQKLIQRLRRIEGQARGLQTMLENERDCKEILQQLTAIHSAVQGVSRVFLQEYAATCLLQMEEENISGDEAHEKRLEVIQDMITLLDKAP